MAEDYPTPVSSVVLLSWADKIAAMPSFRALATFKEFCKFLQADSSIGVTLAQLIVVLGPLKEMNNMLIDTLDLPLCVRQVGVNIFGPTVEGDNIVFILDRSGSMGEKVTLDGTTKTRAGWVVRFHVPTSLWVLPLFLPMVLPSAIASWVKTNLPNTVIHTTNFLGGATANAYLSAIAKASRGTHKNITPQSIEELKVNVFNPELVAERIAAQMPGPDRRALYESGASAGAGFMGAMGMGGWNDGRWNDGRNGILIQKIQLCLITLGF
ncbi:hypothetical protein ADUPG1_009311 [Aduncisulcus paluster]|uniref:Uncharacterized protein n=1 Tax=Aduncisulcus paluster TaxID=2918883 RepID=A0ABQ5KZ32_9EUKA|nr:hypothetical protein ADUPG1_009311 [Aduncisulcus paluster]